MKRFFIFMALVMLCGVSQAADMVWESKTTKVRITELPCAAPLLIAALSPHTTDPIKTAFVTYNGRDITACWIYLPSADLIMLADSDGDIGGILRTSFKDDKGI